MSGWVMAAQAAPPPEWVFAGTAGGLGGWILTAALRRGLHRRAGDPDRGRVPVWAIVVACATAWAVAAARGQVLAAGGGPPGRLLLLAGLFVLATAAIALAVVDIEVHRLPRALTRPMLAGVAVWVTVLAATGVVPPRDLLRCLAAFVALRLAYVLWRRLSPGGRGVGLGDIELAGPLGLVLGLRGWGHVAAGAYLGMLLAGLVAAALLATRRLGPRDPLPHGPFMVAGALLALLGPG